MLHACIYKGQRVTPLSTSVHRRLRLHSFLEAMSVHIPVLAVASCPLSAAPELPMHTAQLAHSMQGPACGASLTYASCCCTTQHQLPPLRCALPCPDPLQPHGHLATPFCPHPPPPLNPFPNFHFAALRLPPLPKSPPNTHNTRHSRYLTSQGGGCAAATPLVAHTFAAAPHQQPHHLCTHGMLWHTVTHTTIPRCWSS